MNLTWHLEGDHNQLKEKGTLSVGFGGVWWLSLANPGDPTGGGIGKNPPRGITRGVFPKMKRNQVWTPLGT